MSYDIQKLKIENFDDYIKIQSNAYTTLEITKEKAELIKTQAAELDRLGIDLGYYGIYKNSELYGVGRFYDFTMNFLSVLVPVGGLGSLAVDLLHKKEKICRDVTLFGLNHFKNKGCPLVIIYPFHPNFYKKMGFGFGAKMSQYKIKPHDLPSNHCKDHLFFVTDKDKKDLIDCYNRYASKTNGLFQHNEDLFDRSFKARGARTIAYKKDGQIQGYVTITFKKGNEDNFLINNLHVNQLIYENREAMLELFTFLNSQSDQISRIIIDTHDENFHFLLNDVRDDSNILIPHVFHGSNHQGVGTMYRVVDVEKVFEVLSSHNFNNASCKLCLDIKDSFMPHNNKKYYIEFNNGLATINNNTNYDVRISMDIAEFASLITGTINFETLYHYNLADISDTSYLDVVDNIFRVKHKPACLTAF
ncbi:GNAT family N-acetyltransferase [Abyssisolibacter fermentans]|uniref:GNAT family N-acetyltransferase n=1 Tax=Abyssisolibacter fermentans TaxID=1766203 RepID=UPI000831644D|nr:GNAT family N-acetyltransferase [Abyssisolibacter fermentans]